MDFEVGAILAGRVSSIMKFGAFVTIAPGKSGLVHISEIANTYVSDVSAYLTQGQDVSVKIIGIDDTGRLNLSIKAALTSSKPGQAPADNPPNDRPRERAHERAPRSSQRSHQSSPGKPAEPAPPPTFEDKLKRFMQDSNSKISDIKQYSDKKSARRRGR